MQLSSDEIYILCRAAQRGHKDISDVVAREIAMRFPGEELSAVFRANGAVPLDSDVLWREIFPHYKDMDSYGRLMANCMVRYLITHAGRGPVDGWRG